MIFNNFLSFAKSVRPISTCSYHFSTSICAQTKMHVDLPMEISVIKSSSSLANLMKNLLSKVTFLNDQNIFLVVTCLRLPDLVGSGFLKA